MRCSSITSAMFASAFVLALTCVIPRHVALAQGAPPDQANPGYSEAPPTINPNTVDEATLKRTANAYVKVKQIVQKRERALNSTDDQAKRQQITEQAEVKEKAAVTAEGLQPQRYNQVIQLAEADPAFQQKFLSYVDKAEGPQN
jgi:hypothetical protein